MTPEGMVKKACEDLLKAERIPYWRMNAGNAVIPGRGRIRLNAPGTADLLAAPNSFQIVSGHWANAGLPIPRFLWIECKSHKGKLTVEQRQFGDFVRDRGHDWLLVDDVDQLADWLAEHRAR